MNPADSTRGRCPKCGEPLRRWPTIDGDGHVVACTSCDFERVVGGESATGEKPEQSTEGKKEPPSAKAEASDDKTAARFRELISAGSDPSQGEWPDSLLADLPEEARELLSKKRQSPPGKRGDGTFRSDLERRLKEHGYYLAEDGRGARLTGEGPRPGTGDLSPLDVVRLAADLEGGVPSPDERTKCPKCDAVVATNESRCPWCGHEMDAPTEDD